MKDAILSTDLAYYFKVRAKLTPVVFDEMFDWENQTHRSMIKSIMMTVCDLSGQCKPFKVAKRITDILYSKYHFIFNCIFLIFFSFTYQFFRGIL